MWPTANYSNPFKQERKTMIMEGENEQSVHCDCVPPLRGVDYWTPEDVAAMESENKAYIIEELAKRNQVKIPVVQSVEEMTDTNLLYLMVKDGALWYYAYSKTVIPGGQPLFDNALEDVNTYINTRWSYSSSAHSTSGSQGLVLTDLIPVEIGQTVYVNLPRGAFLSNYSRIHYFAADGSKLSTNVDRAGYLTTELATDEDGVTSWKAGYHMKTAGDTSTVTEVTGAATMMLCMDLGNVIYGAVGTTITQEDLDSYGLIVSVGKPIAYSEASEGEAWAPIQPLIYTDHTEDVIALKKITDKHSIQIANLEQGASGAVSIREWDKPIYDTAPVTLLGDDRAKKGLTAADYTVEAVYAKYDALMADHPRYITLREDEDKVYSAVNTVNIPNYAGHEMRCYEFREPDGLHNSGYALYETKPKIILMSGVHYEYAGVYSLYYAMEEIATNPDFDDIRRNAHIIVIPCANPGAMTSGRTLPDGWSGNVNANGVEIHCNFGVDHSASGTVGSFQYGGTEAYSEPETAYINDVVQAHSDAIAFVSCHNNDWDTVFGHSVIWASSATPYMCNLAFRLADKLSKAWLADERYGDKIRAGVDAIRGMKNADGTPKYPDLAEGEYRLGRAMMSTSKGTEQKNALQYNMQGVNLEVAKIMRVFNDDATSVASSLCFNAAAMTHGAEVYANFIRAILGAYQPFDQRAHGFLG